MKLTHFLTKHHHPLHSAQALVVNAESKAELTQHLQNASTGDIEQLFTLFNTSFDGLKHEEVLKRKAYYGRNEVAPERQKPFILRFILTFNNPLTLLLLFLVGLSLFTSDTRTAIVVSLMILISVTLKFIQETQAYNASEKLKKMVRTTCTVIRSKKIPLLQTRASTSLIITTAIVMLIGIALTLSPVATAFGFVTMSTLYWPLLALMLTSYVLLTQLVKSWFARKYGYY